LASVESAQGMAQDYLEKLPKAFQSSKRWVMDDCLEMFWLLE
jgi:hypothetical protein